MQIYLALARFDTFFNYRHLRHRIHIRIVFNRGTTDESDVDETRV